MFFFAVFGLDLARWIRIQEAKILRNPTDPDRKHCSKRRLDVLFNKSSKIIQITGWLYINPPPPVNMHKPKTVWLMAKEKRTIKVCCVYLWKFSYWVLYSIYNIYIIYTNRDNTGSSEIYFPKSSSKIIAQGYKV